MQNAKDKKFAYFLRCNIGMVSQLEDNLFAVSAALQCGIIICFLIVNAPCFLLRMFHY